MDVDTKRATNSLTVNHPNTSHTHWSKKGGLVDTYFDVVSVTKTTI